MRPETRPESSLESTPFTRPKSRPVMSGYRILLVLLLVLPISEPKSLRLVGGASRCEGKLEVQGQGLDWTGVKPVLFTLQFANRMCAELDCGSAVSLRTETGTEERKWFIKSNCEATSLVDCLTQLSLPTPYDLYLKCSDSVRLLRGPSLCSGSLELRRDQSWTSVCEEDFDLQDAEVVCRELGCGAPSVLQGALYGEGRALGQMFQCKGHESALMDCPRSSSGNACSSGTAMSLTCSEPETFRLVGGASRCDGTLEVRHRGEWRPVAIIGHLDLETTAAVCRHLDCGSAVSGEIRDIFLDRPVWAVLDNCVKKSSAVRECVRKIDFIVTSRGDVVCSGKPKPTDCHLLLLLLLVPVVLVSVLVFLIFYRKRSSNAERRMEDPQRTSPEFQMRMYENLSPDPGAVDSTYQSLSPETRDHNQVYSQLQPQVSQ